MATNVLAGITFVHSVQYFEKGIDQQGPFYEVEYQIEDWEDADDFINALLGISTYSGTSTTYGTPHRHPLSPNLMCAAARCVGRGRPTLGGGSGFGFPDYQDGAVIRATYRSPVASGAVGGGGVIAPGDDPGWLHQISRSDPILWCTQEIDYLTETLAVESHRYTYQTSGRPLDSPLQIDIPVQVMYLTFHQIPYLPASAIRSRQNKLNSAVFLGCAAETVMFVGARTRREWDTAGGLKQQVMMEFRYRPYSWNKVLLPDKLPQDADAFDYVRGPGGGYRYGLADHRDLVKL
jgi:hypothetical protein